MAEKILKTDERYEEIAKNPPETEGGETPDETPQNGELLQALCERDDFRDKYQRTFSDFNNYKKRMLLARADALADGRCEAVEKMLPVLDSLERAFEHTEECDQQSAIAQGMKMVCRQMCEALEKLGVTEIPALGEVFDPNLHQAMQMTEPCDCEASGRVACVVQKGYALGDRVIRHSMVIVNK